MGDDVMAVTITLNDDLAFRLARGAEQQRLSIQEWATRILEQAADPEHGESAWRDLNARRLALISKEFSSGLTDAENAELDALQEAVARASEPQDRRLLEQLREYEEGTGRSPQRSDA